MTQLSADLESTIRLLERLQTNIRHHQARPTPEQAVEQLELALPTLRRVHAALLEESAGFDRTGKVRNDHRDTAREAALLIAPKTGTQRETILQLLVDHFAEQGHGLADPEIVEWTGLVPNTVRPRRVELVEGGWVMPGFETKVINGREHIVWVPTRKATDHYRKVAVS